MNYYQFHIGDYAGHTRHLSLMEDLAYRRLLDAYYLAERPLNGRSTDVARAIGMRDQIEAVEYVLETFFEAAGDAWRNKRADAEIAHFISKREQASNAGKASAQRRLNGRSTSVDESAADVQPTNNQEPITIETTSDEVVMRDEPKKRAAKKCPEAFVVDDELREWASASAPLVDLDDETARFRDHTFARALVDWRGAWRNWIRRAQDQRAVRPSPRPAAAPSETAYQRTQRETIAALAPGVARRPATVSPIFPTFIDAEDLHHVAAIESR